MNGLQQVDTMDAVAIKAQPEGNSTRQPESPSANMPPQTRSQTTRSRPTNPSSIAIVEEQLSHLSMDVGSDGVGPVPKSPSTKNNRAAHEKTIRTTPRSGKVAASLNSERRQAAHDADPNEGRCFITNRPTEASVQLCHVVAKSIKTEVRRKLEYAWGSEPGKFNVNTRYNLFYLRSDWHFLFDNAKWMLVPEVKILKELHNIYEADERSRIDLSKRFSRQSVFHYFLVPAPSLREVICRFADVESHKYNTFEPPFFNLGCLSSHIHPHYVIFNSGQKWSKKNAIELTQTRGFISQIFRTNPEDVSPLDYIQVLYNKWTGTELPAGWRENDTPPSSSPAPSEEREDGLSEDGPPPTRSGARSVTRSRGQGAQPSGGQYERGRQRAILPFQQSEDGNSSSVTDDTVVEDDTAWVEFIHNWKKKGEDAAKQREPDMLNNPCDEQLAAYNNEHARTPPSPGAWYNWKPTWDIPKSPYLTASDRSRFSSNDWAVFWNDAYLTRSEHPQTTL